MSGFRKLNVNLRNLFEHAIEIPDNDPTSDIYVISSSEDEVELVQFNTDIQNKLNDDVVSLKHEEVIVEDANQTDCAQIVTFTEADILHEDSIDFDNFLDITSLMPSGTNLNEEHEVQFLLDSLLDTDNNSKNVTGKHSKISEEIAPSIEKSTIFYPNQCAKAFSELYSIISSSLDVHKQELFGTLYPIMILVYQKMVSEGFVSEATQFFEEYKSDFDYFHNDNREDLQNKNNFIDTTDRLINSNKKVDIFKLAISNEAYNFFNKQMARFPTMSEFVMERLEFRICNDKLSICDINLNFIKAVKFWNENATIMHGLHKEPYFDLARSFVISTGDIDIYDGANGSPKAKKHRQDRLPYKRTKSDYNSPPIDRIPIPALRYSEKKAKFQEWGAFSKRIRLESKGSPSVCFYTLHNTNQSVTCAEISDDSSMLVCGFSNSIIRVWSLTPNKLRSLKEPDQLKKLDVDIADIYVRMLDDTNGMTMRKLCGHSGPVYRCTFSFDQTQLLSCSEDTTIRLWSLYTWQCLSTYRCHQLPIWNVCFSQTGHYFISGSNDRTAMLWTTNAIRPLRIFTGHLSDVDCVQFHPNTNYVATGSSDFTIRIFDVLDAKTVQLFAGHKGAVYSLKFSRCGRFLVSGAADGMVIIWDLENGSTVKTLNHHRGPIHTHDFCRDGNLLAVGGLDCRLSFWKFGKLISDYLRETFSSHSKNENSVKVKDRNYLLSTYPSKQTPFLAVHFTRTNLVLAAGAFDTSNK